VQMVAGEGPVVEGGASVMVFDECHSAGGPHAQQTWRPPLAVYQSPILTSPHGLLQYACAVPQVLMASDSSLRRLLGTPC
jgi:hypothetical protein